jgi:hypothetical protein
MENDIVPCEIPEKLTVTLTGDDIRSLWKIHEYLYAAEKNNWEGATPAERETHIFSAVNRLDRLLQELLYHGPC